MVLVGQGNFGFFRDVVPDIKIASPPGCFFCEKKPDFRAPAVIKQQRRLCWIFEGAALVAEVELGIRRYDANGGGIGYWRRRTSLGTRRRWKR